MLPAFFRLIGNLFFREIVIEGRENLPSHGPAILALNHPNDLLDPLLTLFLSPPLRLRHIAKASLFRVPVVGGILRRMRAIPVLRRQEAPGPVDYTPFFDACVAALADGETVVIFPEGGSYERAFLGPLKTGAARLHFLARAGGIDAPIIPVGINYEEGSIFRSSVLLLAAQPVSGDRLASLYASDPAAAVRELTAEVQRVLGEHVFQAESYQDRELIVLLERICHESEPGGRWAERYRRLEAFKERVSAMRQCCPGRIRRLRRQVARYRRLSRIGGTRTGQTPWTPGEDLLGALGSLAAWTGWVFNWVPYRIVRWLVERRRIPRTDIATMKIAWSLLVFPPAYLAEAILVGTALGWPAALLFGAGILPMTWLTLRYFEWRETLGIRPNAPHAFFGGRWSRHTERRLRRLRERIVREVDLLPASAGASPAP
ncbi:MAG TPA: 1-acyl-sn-glycerol-3-phosphate acyltransferase [Syntrophales bacterium]|nr:1-acyl-sn-glycerol-3-phosphate acyltransferase [Syntrophobacterales bacterium]HQL89695.1 1-acyl-sn-glycerol-3-phosphate acyltransferase [Syntrophales bacterium]